MVADIPRGILVRQGYVIERSFDFRGEFLLLRIELQKPVVEINPQRATTVFTCVLVQIVGFGRIGIVTILTDGCASAEVDEVVAIRLPRCLHGSNTLRVAGSAV